MNAKAHETIRPFIEVRLAGWRHRHHHQYRAVTDGRSDSLANCPRRLAETHRSTFRQQRAGDRIAVSLDTLGFAASRLPGIPTGLPHLRRPADGDILCNGRRTDRSGPPWVKGIVYSLLLWLANAFIVLPWIGEGVAGSRHLDLAGMVYFGFAHTVFFLALALLYHRFTGNAQSRSDFRHPR